MEMKKLAALLVVALAATSASAFPATYIDTANDTLLGGGILDILQVDVANTQTDLSFTFTLNGDVQATDWGKYMVMIDSAPGGDPASNGWVRPISWAPNPGGADYWLGGWEDSGNGQELRGFDGVNWNLIDASYSNGLATNVKTQFTVTETVKLASMNLVANANPTICFDAFSSGGGGGDGAIDSLGNPAQQIANWGDPSSAHPVCYTLTPEPATLSLLGLGALALIRRKR
jgi:hypothetical protein